MSDESYSFTIRVRRRRLKEVLGGVVIVAAFVVTGVFMVQGCSLLQSADEGKARHEVQRWYEQRYAGRVAVSNCDYAPQGDSDYDSFSCRVMVACPETVVFHVP